jgi:hypothetical protein
VLIDEHCDLHRQTRRLAQVGRLQILGCVSLPFKAYELAQAIGNFSESRRSYEAMLPTRDESPRVLWRPFRLSQAAMA